MDESTKMLVVGGFVLLVGGVGLYLAVCGLFVLATH